MQEELGKVSTEVTELLLATAYDVGQQVSEHFPISWLQQCVVHDADGRVRVYAL